jgi:tight adherence protein B
MDDTLLIAGALVFFAAFLATEGLYLWWNSRHGAEAKRISKRLRMMSAGGNVDDERASLLKRRLLADQPLLEQLLMRVPRVRGVDRFLVQAGADWTVSTFLGITGGLFLAGLLGGLVARLPLAVAVMLGALLAVLPAQWLLWQRHQRTQRFERQLPEALDLIGRALRAGHAFSSALQMAGSELPDPIGEEFRQTFDEINYGVPTHDALQNLVDRVPSTDLGFFVIAVLVQRETGGNLSEVLDNISAIIRERLKLFGKVRALSAEGRFSALVLSVLPVVTALLLYVINPDFMSLLWTEPVGVKLIWASAACVAFGALWMRRIIRIRV